MQHRRTVQREAANWDCKYSENCLICKIFFKNTSILFQTMPYHPGSLTV